VTRWHTVANLLADADDERWDDWLEERDSRLAELARSSVGARREVDEARRSAGRRNYRRRKVA
jgi:hypothetical protein